MASSGTRTWAKKSAVDHTNITTVIRKGMMVQVSSSRSEPSISAGRSSVRRRRYLTAKNKTAAEMRTVKNAVTASMKK